MSAPIGVLGEGLFELRLEGDGDGVAAGYGGDAANIAVMAVRIGGAARLCGRVGHDPLGDRLISFWEGAGVDVEHVRRDSLGPTGIYVNEAIAPGEHRFSYHRHGSAGSRLEGADVTDEFLSGLAAVVVTGITLAVSHSSASAARAALDAARAAGSRTVCVVNHRPRLAGDPAALAELAGACDTVILSREEVSTVFGCDSAEALIDRLDDGSREILVSDGARPVIGAAGGRPLSQHVPRVDPVDAAGAGDALAGAYVALRVAGARPAGALASAVAAASLSVRTTGCAASYPTAAEVDALVAGS